MDLLAEAAEWHSNMKFPPWLKWFAVIFQHYRIDPIISAHCLHKMTNLKSEAEILLTFLEPFHFLD